MKQGTVLGHVRARYAAHCARERDRKLASLLKEIGVYWVQRNGVERPQADFPFVLVAVLVVCWLRV